MTERVMCIRETDQNFYAAVKREFYRQDEGFRRLDFLASSVHLLDEGSQIFVFDRENFGWSGDSPEAEFLEHIKTTVKEIGGIALDSKLLPVYQHDIADAA